jgi:ATP-dependent Clp endopeptidase proteolytic subunit ClpP
MGKNWFEFTNKGEKNADIWIYSEVGGYDVNAQSFIKELQEVKDKDINVHINSLGGDVFDGLAIYNALKNHAKQVTIKIEGIAASIASVIAMAGDKIEMAENSLFMIHNPFVMAGGDATELRKTASILDKIRDEIANIYTTKSSQDVDTLVGLMEVETWFNAIEANELGFANGITQPIKVENNYDISKFNNITHDKINSVINNNNSKKVIMAKTDVNTEVKDENKNLLSQIKDLFVNQAPEIKNAPEDEESEAERTDWAKTYEELKDRVDNLENAIHDIEEKMGMAEDEVVDKTQQLETANNEIQNLQDENSKLKATKTDVVPSNDPTIVKNKSVDANLTFYNAMADAIKRHA